MEVGLQVGECVQARYIADKHLDNLRVVSPTICIAASDCLAAATSLFERCLTRRPLPSIGLLYLACSQLAVGEWSAHSLVIVIFSFCLLLARSWLWVYGLLTALVIVISFIRAFIFFEYTVEVSSLFPPPRCSRKRELSSA